jgi:hypothetical protein
MGVDDRAVDHQVLVVAAYASVAPAAETFMHRLPLAIPIRQVAQCAPERNTHRQPLMNRRLSEPLRPGSLIFPGNNDAIFTHWTSLSSYRLIAIVSLRDENGAI